MESGYPERTSGIECGIPAAGDHLISRLEAAPTESLSNGNLDFLYKQEMEYWVWKTDGVLTLISEGPKGAWRANRKKKALD